MWTLIFDFIFYDKWTYKHNIMYHQNKSPFAGEYLLQCCEWLCKCCINWVDIKYGERMLCVVQNNRMKAITVCLKVLSSHSSAGIKKNHKNFNCGNLCFGWDSETCLFHKSGTLCWHEGCHFVVWFDSVCLLYCHISANSIHSCDRLVHYVLTGCVLPEQLRNT